MSNRTNPTDYNGTHPADIILARRLRALANWLDEEAHLLSRGRIGGMRARDGKPFRERARRILRAVATTKLVDVANYERAARRGMYAEHERQLRDRQ